MDQNKKILVIDDGSAGFLKAQLLGTETGQEICLIQPTNLKALIASFRQFEIQAIVVNQVSYWEKGAAEEVYMIIRTQFKKTRIFWVTYGLVPNPPFMQLWDNVIHFPIVKADTRRPHELALEMATMIEAHAEMDEFV